MKQKQTAEEGFLLLPIILGSVAVILVASILVFFIIRKKKAQVKYDEEKSQGITEESKKLSKQMEEVINGEKR